MPAKKILILSLVISLAGHLLTLSLTGFIDMQGGSEREDILTIDLKEPWKRPGKNRGEKEKVEPPQPQIEGETTSSEYLEKTAALDSNDDRYISYLRKIKKKIENIWTYPQKAYEQKEEGVAVVKFSITKSGALLDPVIMTSSGSKLLDGETIGAVKAAAPYDPLPRHFNLSRLNIVAEFQYRLTE
ncbi:MAG: TonB family protein [Syntrophales bacterium]|nr:TonB family protein [Syntrophales bacterium]